MPTSESLVDRVRRTGVASASPFDLIAIGFSRREADANDAEGMARELLSHMGGIYQIGDLSPTLVKEVTGLEGFDALRVRALIEVGRRAGNALRGEQKPLECASEVAYHFRYLAREKQEHFCVALLDSKNQIIKTTTVHVGTLNSSIVGPREVFREAIREGAASVIVVHNHPSGDPTPSPEDIQVTDALVEVGKALDIPVVDHVIIGEPNFISFRERGFMS